MRLIRVFIPRRVCWQLSILISTESLHFRSLLGVEPDLGTLSVLIRSFAVKISRLDRYVKGMSAAKTKSAIFLAD